MTSILFVCLGNICRSPMAEYILKDMVRKAGREAAYRIESAGTESFNTGRPVYREAEAELAARNVDCRGHRARQIRRSDYEKFDLLIGMDRENVDNMRRICGGDSAGKIHLLMEYTDRPGDVLDPWYTGDYGTARQDIEEGCRGLFHWLETRSAADT